LVPQPQRQLQPPRKPDRPRRLLPLHRPPQLRPVRGRHQPARRNRRPRPVEPHHRQQRRDQPWSARTVSGRLEYYFEGVGQLSAGAFHREFENFFGNVTFLPTPEFLALYALDADTYGAYDVATQHNIADTVRMTGFDLSYKQALTFLPRWARGVHAFANISTQRAVGDASANFQGYNPRKASWGASLVREKFNFRVNWSYQGRTREGAVTGNSIPPGTYTYTVRRLFVDVLGEYYLTPRFGLYFTLRDVLDMPVQTGNRRPRRAAARHVSQRRIRRLPLDLRPQGHVLARKFPAAASAIEPCVREPTAIG